MGPSPEPERIVGIVMRAWLQTSMMVGVLVFTAAAPLRAAEPTAAGLWEQIDDKTGKPESWFKITERNGVYEGAVVKIFFKARRGRELGLRQMRRRGKRPAGARPRP